MTDQDGSPNANPRLRRPMYRDADTTNGNLLSTAALNPAGEIEPRRQTSSNPDNRHTEKRLSAGAHRTQKHRSSGGFLLTDSLFNRQGNARPRNASAHAHTDKRHQKSIEQPSHTAAQHGEQRSQSRASSSIPHPSSDLGYSPRPSMQADESSTSTAVAKRDSFAGDTAVGSSPGTSIAQLDMESAQIVNMALNLSESRRLASRRNVSQPTPPRLVPLPDGAAGGSLRYHLQQQRKISRTVSPKPDRSPRIGTPRVLTPLQSAFESGGSYRYHFSQSTLARAQKAKEYLELMAQYRRVLELLAPLEAERTTRPWTASPPGTPNGSTVVYRLSTSDSETKIGRPYDPLQYIRNRKVRARERKAIDGEAQGFNDVIKVSEWIDDVAKWVATGQARIPGNAALPPFAGAQAAALQASPPPTNARTAAAATKPKRPRVDWVINPADMLADVYWLELDDNKKLVEDRHWRRVFPQGPDFPRPLSGDEAAPRLATPGSTKDWSDTHTSAEKTTPDPPPSRHEQEHGFSAARDRAQQKLRALKGAHHRHASAVTNRDLLRLHRSSLSESSDTDSDRWRRKGSASGPVRSILEMQIEAMIAREQREAESHPLYDHEALRMKFSPMTPEREPPHASLDATNSHRRIGSRAELSETEGKGRASKPLSSGQTLSLHPAGRASLEVPNSTRRFSIDDDTSHPNSPEMRPARDAGIVPTIGMDLSPTSSRPSSPHRNPLTKVKSIFRERSKEREDAIASLNPPPPDAYIGSPETAGSGVSSPQRRPSRSPIGERLMGHRSHKSLNNARLRGEDGGISLRSFFRGPRIDTVLRSGVSKVSDMIWRKDGGEEFSSTSSSDSETEARGRSRGPRGSRRGHNAATQDAKGMLEAPQFVAVRDYAKPGAHGQLVQHPPSRPISRRSSRFDLLKPPRIDIEHASPSVSPPPQLVGRQPAGSDTESQGGRDGIAVSLDAALAFPPRPQPSPAPSARHWSIADRGGPPARSTLSKREIARLRALLLSSGIHAMEMSRLAKQRKLLPNPMTASPETPPAFTLPAIAALTPDPATAANLLTTPLAQTDLYPLAARTLATSVEASASHFNTLASRFASETAPGLTHRVESLRNKVAGELAALAQDAADAADEANHDLVVGQRLKVKRVVDVMEKMLRRRRRRFRWVRRAGWLVVEWVLVGCMWYVWFVVMLARVLFGVVGGIGRGVRWLLWL